MNLESSLAKCFSLPDENGKIHSLKDYKDKYVILYFYPKDNTPGCTKQACSFRDLLPKISAFNAIVLGVSKDGQKSHQNFINKFQLPFSLLCDEDLQVIKDYGCWVEKAMYGKKYMGVSRSTVIINPQGLIIKHWEKIRKVEKHPQEVVEFLQNL